MKFEEKLQKLRKEKGLSQESLGELLGVSRQAISKWESGGSYPELEKLIVISDMFGVTIDSLVKEGELEQEAMPTFEPAPHLYSRYEYEYKSERTFLGLPLVHVSLGKGKKFARGIVAIGNTAIGVVSIGLVSVGVVSLGLVSVGLLCFAALGVGFLLSIGAIALGTIAIGAISVGIFTVGALSVGAISIGACAAGTQLAIGDIASGHIAIGRIVDGIKTIQVDSTNNLASKVSSAEVRALLNSEFPSMWHWIVNLISGFFYG